MPPMTRISGISASARGRRGGGAASPPPRPCARSRAGRHGGRTGRSSCAGHHRSPPGISPASGGRPGRPDRGERSEEHTSELQSRENLVCRLLLEKKKKKKKKKNTIQKKNNNKKIKTINKHE